MQKKLDRNCPEVRYCALPLIGMEADCGRGQCYDLGESGEGVKSLVGVTLFWGSQNISELICI